VRSGEAENFTFVWCERHLPRSFRAGGVYSRLRFLWVETKDCVSKNLAEEFGVESGRSLMHVKKAVIQ